MPLLALPEAYLETPLIRLFLGPFYLESSRASHPAWWRSGGRCDGASAKWHSIHPSTQRAEGDRSPGGAWNAPVVEGVAAKSFRGSPNGRTRRDAVLLFERTAHGEPLSAPRSHARIAMAFRSRALCSDLSAVCRRRDRLGADLSFRLEISLPSRCP